MEHFPESQLTRGKKRKKNLRTSSPVREGRKPLESSGNANFYHAYILCDISGNDFLVCIESCLRACIRLRLEFASDEDTKALGEVAIQCHIGMKKRSTYRNSKIMHICILACFL